jgi:nitroreductase
MNFRSYLMDALEALHTRTSMSALTDAGPSEAQLRAILQAGVRANDHGMMRPWKFLIIEGDHAQSN